MKKSWRDGYSDFGGSRGGGWGGRGSSNSGYGGRSQFDERGSYGGYRRRGGYQGGNNGGGGGRRDYGAGYWKEGAHHIGPRNPHVEKELFGTPEDKETTHTGINFDKYDNIPVEASGRDVPASIEEVKLIQITCCCLYLRFSIFLLLVYFSTNRCSFIE